MAKKTKGRSKNSVNVDAVKRDVKKLAKEMSKNSSDAQGNIELSPGSVRRESPLEQKMGTKKYHEMIHDHNDKNKHILDRLPFTFPRKSVVRSHRNDIVVTCVECGYEKYGTEFTIGITCPKCNTYREVTNPEAEKRGEDRDFKPGFLATASDILRMREKRAKKKS